MDKATEQQNNKRIAKNTLLLYFRMLLILGISLYTSRIVLDTLGVVDYGIYNVVGGFVSTFAVLSGVMTTATQRFISFEIGLGPNGNVQRIFSTTLVVHFILAVVIFVLAETIGLYFLNNQMRIPEDRMDAAYYVFQLSLITFLINVVSVPYTASIIAYEKMKAFAFVSIVEASLKLIIVFLIIKSSSDKLVLYALFLMLTAVSIRVMYSVYCRRNFEKCRFSLNFNTAETKKIFSFVGWNLIGSCSAVAKDQGVNVVLNLFFGTAVNAARGVAYQVLNALNGFATNFQLAMNPQIVKSYASKDYEGMFRIVFKGSRLSFLMLLILTSPILMEAETILNLWLVKVPEYTVLFLRLVLVTAMIDSLSGTLVASMHASGNVTIYQIVVGGISLLTLPMVYLFLKSGFSPYSALVICLIMAFVCHIARAILLHFTIQLPLVQYLKKVTARDVLVSVVSFIAPVVVKVSVPGTLTFSIVVAFISVLSAILASWFLGVDPDEKHFVIAKTKTILHRGHNG